MEFYADGVVGGVGARPFGFGGILDLQPGSGDLFQELVAVGAEAGGGALGAALPGLGTPKGGEGGEQLLTPCRGYLGQLIGSGEVVDALGVLLEDGAAHVDILADAVIAQGGGVRGGMFLPGAGLEGADDDDERFFGGDFFLGFEDAARGRLGGGTAEAARLGALGEQRLDLRLGNIVGTGRFIVGGELREVIRLQGDPADLLGFAEGGELRLIERRGGALRSGSGSGWRDGCVRHGSGWYRVSVC